MEEYINIVEKGIMSANNNQEDQKRVDAKDPEEEKSPQLSFPYGTGNLDRFRKTFRR